MALNRAAAAVSPPPRALPPLMFFTDPERTPEPWRTAARLPAGAAVVYRAFGAGDALTVAQRLRGITRERGVRLLIGADATLAERVGADGVHLPERALAEAPPLRRAHADWLLTGAAHSAAAVERARGLDALVVSPVFAPGGERSARRPALGIEGFGALALHTTLPVYALGGISAANAVALARSGACGLCGVDGVDGAFAG